MKVERALSKGGKNFSLNIDVWVEYIESYQKENDKAESSTIFWFYFDIPKSNCESEINLASDIVNLENDGKVKI